MVGHGNGLGDRYVALKYDTTLWIHTIEMEKT